MNAFGLDTETLVQYLRECLDAETYKVDKKGDIRRITDLNVRLKTLDMIFKLRGDYLLPLKSQDAPENVEELFKGVTDESK